MNLIYNYILASLLSYQRLPCIEGCDNLLLWYPLFVIFTVFTIKAIMLFVEESIILVSILSLSIRDVYSQLQVEADVRNCPTILDRVWAGYVPKGNKQAGTFKDSGSPALGTCVEICCENPICNIVFMFNATCYQVISYNLKKKIYWKENV